MTPEFWQGKKVFVTGHTGFKGSWLSLWLQPLAAEVSGYALAPPTEPSLFCEADVASGMQSITGDIRDLAHLVKVLKQCQPEIVIHMAAQPLVRYSYRNPVETYATNVMGTVHLLEAVRQTASVRAVVNVTTDKCYENQERIWGYRENEAMGGYDPYSNSKGCSELVTSAYRDSFFNPNDYQDHGVGLASARAGNVIGGGDWAEDRLIPDILAAFLRKQPVIIRNPHAIRPWQHVLEPLRGYLTLAEKLYTDGVRYAEPWNFGPGDSDAQPVSWIVEKMVAMWGEEVGWQLDDVIHPHEASYLKLDISKSRSYLDWHPVLNLENALSMIVEWTTLYAQGVNAKSLTQRQIQTYQTLLNN